MLPTQLLKNSIFLIISMVLLSTAISAQTEKSKKDSIPIIKLSETDFQEDGHDIKPIMYKLSASKRLFTYVSGFNLGFLRFNERGYQNYQQPYYLNGIPVMDLESGRGPWSMWSGLNDMTRGVEEHNLPVPMDFGFGGLAGGVNMDIMASNQRKGVNLSLSETNNNNYRHRIMASYVSGWLKGGWAIAASGSHRWTEEAYIPGTFYDGYSYYLSVDKRIKRKHIIGMAIFGAPSKRGKAGATVQEMYDIAGTNFYNPYWGYQNGEKRNSRNAYSNQPVGLLRHKYNSRKFSWSTAILYQGGTYYDTALDWYNAPDPRPDYYRKLPSYATTEDSKKAIYDALSQNEKLRQIDWDKFYYINRNNEFTVENTNGESGNTTTGNRSLYTLEGRHYDGTRLNGNSTIGYELTNDITLQAGVSYQKYKAENYKTIEDLLGGDYYYDIDKYAERDIPGNIEIQQTNLDVPNHVANLGDRFGYDYDITINKTSAWTQLRGVFGHFDSNIGVEGSQTQFWRTGNYRNGKFPDNSFGDSEKPKFTNYGLKAGTAYSLNPRHIFYAYGSMSTKAPYFRNSMVSARTRNEFAPNLNNEEILSGDFGYLHRTGDFNFEINGYFATRKNQTKSTSFYHDGEQSFVNYIMTGIDTKHTGIEAAYNVKIYKGLFWKGALGIGQHIYTSRPKVLISRDNNAENLATDRTVYLKNFYVPGSPQTIATTELEYQGKQHYAVNLAVAYEDNNWIEPNPDRRTTEALETDNIDIKIDPDSDLFKKIIYQEKANSGFVLNLSFRKSIRIDYDHFVYFNFILNNVLNNTNIIGMGREQLRFDSRDKNVDKFPAKYYYAKGTNFYFSVRYSFR